MVCNHCGRYTIVVTPEGRCGQCDAGVLYHIEQQERMFIEGMQQRIADLEQQLAASAQPEAVRRVVEAARRCVDTMCDNALWVNMHDLRDALASLDGGEAGEETR